MAVSVREPRMDVRLTDEQRRDFDEKGYVLIEDFFEPDELKRLLAAIEEVRDRYSADKGVDRESAHFGVRNALAHHEAFLDLVDHPRMLPLVVDVFGWNIQIRTTHLDVRPPYPKEMVVGEWGT